MVTSRTVAAVMRRIAVKQSEHLREESPMQVPAFVKDLAERAVKTFAYAMLGSLPVTAATTPVVGVPWLDAAQIAASATVLSVLGSLASLKFGNSGTASLTTAVEPAKS